MSSFEYIHRIKNNGFFRCLHVTRFMDAKNDYYNIIVTKWYERDGKRIDNTVIYHNVLKQEKAIIKNIDSILTHFEYLISEEGYKKDYEDISIWPNGKFKKVLTDKNIML